MMLNIHNERDEPAVAPPPEDDGQQADATPSPVEELLRGLWNVHNEYLVGLLHSFEKFLRRL